VCGDLTSALDFAHPDFTAPRLPAVVSAGCPGTAHPTPPAVQTPPVQEPGPRAVLTPSTLPGASVSVDCAANLVHLVLTNAGPATAHLVVYNLSSPIAVRDIAAGGAASADYPATAAGGYDITCHGPAGFVRRFAGSTKEGCGVEVAAALDPSQGGLVLTFWNPGAAPVVFTVTNGYATGGPWTVTAPGSGRAVLPLGGALSSGAYDFGVTAAGDPAFLRRLAGRIAAEPPALTVSRTGDALEVSFPVQGAGFALESANDPLAGPWLPVPGAAFGAGGVFRAPITPGPAPRYFRLHR
jgi:phospholipase C